MNDKHQNLINTIRIINTDSIGSITFFKLLSAHQSTEKVLEILPSIIANKGIKIPSEDFAKQEIEIAEKENIKTILWNDSEYPNSLQSIYANPVLIYAKGNHTLLQNKSVAIVGTRNPSISSKKFVIDIAKEITSNNLTTVSGMAIGVDTFAHIGSITENSANTIAVLGGGVNDVYPSANRNLYNEIINKGGLILSERGINYTAKASDFPKRNRIIAGLSCALILTEATEKSGSLITTRYAMEQGKLVYAIPSHPSDPRAYGPNKLIANGGKIFSTAADFIKDLHQIFSENNGKIYDPIFYDRKVINSIKDISEIFTNEYKSDEENNPSPTSEKPDAKIKKYIINSVSSIPTDTETIFQDTKGTFNITISKFYQIILEMELDGTIVNANGQITKS